MKPSPNIIYAIVCYVFLTFKSFAGSIPFQFQLPKINLGKYSSVDSTSSNTYKMATTSSNQSFYIAFPSYNCRDNSAPSVILVDKKKGYNQYLDNVECITASNGSTYKADDVQIAINQQTNQPTIAFIDEKNNNTLTILTHDCQGSTCLWKPVNTSNTSEQLPHHDIGHISLALDNSGNPFVAFQNKLFNDGPQKDNRISVIKIDLAGKTWAYVGGINFSDWSRGYITLALDSHNQPYLAYLDWNYAPQVERLQSGKKQWDRLPMPTTQWVKGYGNAADFILAGDLPILATLYTPSQIGLYKYNTLANQWEHGDQDNLSIDKKLPAHNGQSYNAAKAYNPKIVVNDGGIKIGLLAQGILNYSAIMVGSRGELKFDELANSKKYYGCQLTFNNTPSITVLGDGWGGYTYYIAEHHNGVFYLYACDPSSEPIN